MKFFRMLLVVLMLVSATQVGLCGDEEVVLEITGATLTPSSSQSSTWGWWNPGKYDEWLSDNESNVALNEARLLVSGSTYTVILGGEWYPTLSASGSFIDPQSGETVVEEPTMDISTYDLGLGQIFGRGGRIAVMPWIGATYVRVSEELRIDQTGSSTGDGGKNTASSGLWGVAGGADLRVNAWSKLDVIGRVTLRWATGTRNATLNTQDPGSGQGGAVELSDSVDQYSWGADLGLRWAVTGTFEFEGGWRYRDWTLNDGPASFGGPYLKVVLVF